MSTDVSALCHCGSIRLEVDAPPSEVTECNCSLCRRYGVLWAYCPPRQVRMSPPILLQTSTPGVAGPSSSTAAGTAAASRIGLPQIARETGWASTRLLPPEIQAGARLRHRDGAGTNRHTDWREAVALALVPLPSVEGLATLVVGDATEGRAVQNAFEDLVAAPRPTPVACGSRRSEHGSVACCCGKRVGRGEPSQGPDLRDELGRLDDTRPCHGPHDARRGVVSQQLLQTAVKIGDALPGAQDLRGDLGNESGLGLRSWQFM
jgi:hypothetical protein